MIAIDDPWLQMAVAWSVYHRLENGRWRCDRPTGRIHSVPLDMSDEFVRTSCNDYTHCMLCHNSACNAELHAGGSNGRPGTTVAAWDDRDGC